MQSPSWFQRMLGHMTYPDAYVVLDCETSGLSFTTDLVTQLGYCLVQDREVVATGALMLDWTRDPRIDGGWLEDRLGQTQRQMEAKGATCHMTFRRLREEGMEPSLALEAFRGLLEDARARGEAFLAHNAWGFDVPMIHAMYARFTDTPFEFRPDEVYDSGILAKAVQLDAYPLPGESQKDFYKRIHGKRVAGVKWSLSNHCVPTYGLIEKHGLNTALAHDAGYDCLLTHHLFEHFRGLSESRTAA